MGGVFTLDTAIKVFVDAVNQGDAVAIEPYAPGRAVRTYDLDIPLSNYGHVGYPPEVMVSEAIYWETRPHETNPLTDADHLAAWGIDITTPLY